MTVARDEVAAVLAEVRRIEIQARRLVTGVMAGGYLSVFRGSGIEFETVRAYEEGDDPRAVDWSVTARMGRPFVKTFTEERELTLLFLLDRSSSMDAGLGAWSPRRIAARVVAYLALSAARSGDRVGLVTTGGPRPGWVAPARGAGHALRIVRDVLVGTADRDAPLRPAIEFAARAVRRHAIVFVISDFLSGGWERPLGLCARRHDVVAVRLLSPELRAPNPALVRLLDPETGRRSLVDFRSKRVRAAYAANVAAWSERTERTLARAGVDRVDVPIPRERDGDPVAGPILRFFRMREQRGMKR